MCLCLSCVCKVDEHEGWQAVHPLRARIIMSMNLIVIYCSLRNELKGHLIIACFRLYPAVNILIYMLQRKHIILKFKLILILHIILHFSPIHKSEERS